GPDSRATLLDTDYGDNPGSWSLGRHNSDATSFFINTGTNVGYYAVGFPDHAPTGDSGGWHYYVITFDGSTIRGYFDAQLAGVFPLGGTIDRLKLGGSEGYYLAVGTWAHNGTPQFGDDQYPNCCWMNGKIADIRIYKRVLTTNEISALYYSFDKQAPTIPANLWARTAASNQVELRWNTSVDNFSVAGYTVRRNGSVVGTATGPAYVDSGLAANTSYQYTVDAF